MKNYIFAFLMMLVAVPACMWAKDNNKATAVFTVSPKMTCQNCENKIKSNLRFEKGVSSIVTNLKEQTVTITYNPAKVSPERLTEAFKKIGYDATQCSEQCKEGDSPAASAATGHCATTTSSGSCCGAAKSKPACPAASPSK